MVAGIIQRRWFVATALALFVHLAMLPLLPKNVAASHSHPPTLIVKMIRLRHEHRRHHHVHRVRRHRIPARHIHSSHGAKAAGRPRPTHHFRRAAAPPKIHRRHELAKASPVPVRQASAIPSPASVEANGLQGSQVAAPVVAGGGAGGAAQEGNGSASEGNGVGAGEIPCGVPDLVREATKTINLPNDASGTAPEPKLVEDTIRATIHFPDGSAESALFPYPFIYRSSEEDPFDRRNRNNAQLLILVQRPPNDFDQNALPPVIRMILSRTSEEGISVFLPCKEGHE